MVGKDKPDEIADWAQESCGRISEVIEVETIVDAIPQHDPAGVSKHVQDEVEFDRLAQEYHQQEQTGTGKVLAMDGKALRGTRIAGQERSDHVLSVYDVQDQCVLAQQTVDSKENEIVAAPGSWSKCLWLERL